VSRHYRLSLLLALVAGLFLTWPAESAAQYPWWGPYPYPRAYIASAAVRFDVKPKEAEVYVDGYYAGTVDDFNGVFQRLRLPPGEHEIVLYRDGYRAAHQRIYLTPDNTFKLKLEMERLSPGEQSEDRPQPANPPPAAGPPPPGAPGGAPGAPGYPYPPRGPMGRRGPQPPPPPANQAPGAQSGAFGTLSIRVTPADADVMVDGERRAAPPEPEPLTLDLPEGRHTIEIRRQGYITYITEIDVHRGQTTPLTVSLRSQDDR
jgi:hypothetical protein